MRCLILLLFFTACSDHESKTQKFVIVTDTNDEWVNYEGNWMTEGGVVHMELALKAGAHGLDAEYRLHESFVSEELATGTSSASTYSTSFRSLSGNTLGIILRGLSTGGLKTYFRYKNEGNHTEEMYFITRGQDELIPCNSNFEPLTTDRRYTLHRRSDLFTVEGYVTFDSDSIEFHERNTGKNYSVSNLGEFKIVKDGYSRLAKEKYEGIYLRALAYTVVDSTAMHNRALVFKRLNALGDEVIY